ncbi:NADP-specific glutamate dehydrogenase [Tropicimonas sp. S265A]|uniref:NADP-specific glutamate dehydrogenase n=1 Tax=Tropicimonas sp. S265A TaxID=3415134 RepID=UPI003C7C5E10
MSRESLLSDYMDRVVERSVGEDAFHQAVRHVAHDTITIEKANSDYAAAKVMERLSIPDRVIAFRVVWQDDRGETQVNQGWRVQYSNAIGPYKGGLRFHPAVSLSVLKFLGFEQTFKNALTSLPLGGGKGGSDFDPTGRSDAEIMRFCQAFMRELAPFIGPNRDVPAGDINVGSREIGWMFAVYKAHALEFTGALTGKGLSFGGSQIRTEATGYGLIYFVEAMLGEQGDDLSDKRVGISGKGNVATYAADKAIARGAKVVTLSDTSGVLVAEDGLDADTVAWVRAQKAAGKEIADPPSGCGATFKEGDMPWNEDLDVALPCATQNELDGDMARALIDGGVRLIAEGANMPLTDDAHDVVSEAGMLHAPGKASNAGGVAVSGLEMSQNSHRRFATADEVDAALKDIMRDIHARVIDDGRQGNHVDYVRGANIAGFRKVADAISSMGAI